MTRLSLLICILLLSTAFVPHAQSHNRSQSYSSWNVADQNIEMVFTVKAREVTRLAPLEPNYLTLESLLVEHIRKTVRVASADDITCPAVGAPRALAAASGHVRVSASFSCGSRLPSTISIESFFAVAPSHVHHSRVLVEGVLPGEYLFTDSRRAHGIVRSHSDFDRFQMGFLQYLRLGVEHILGGFDHIAFLLALLLLIPNFRELIWLVSGFTIGHSITLSLAVLGLVFLEMWVVEALIGFTIAFVAAENVGVAAGQRRLVGLAVVVLLSALGLVSAGWGLGLPLMTLSGLWIFTLAYMCFNVEEHVVTRLRPTLTLVFGLIHGFGFASVLGETGLPDDGVVAALVGFNIGVELGQITVVAALWWLLRWFTRSRFIWGFRPWQDVASTGLCGLGVFWFISRSFLQV